MDLRGWRARLRLTSALVLLAFVICHLSGHSLLLLSQPFAESGLAALMRPWRSPIGTALLVSAFLIHYANALWSVYERRSLRLRNWEWAQLGLGLCIPALLALHVASTRLAEETMGVDTGYGYVLVEYWVVAPSIAVLQATALLTVWAHACIGIHFWLRTKAWYPEAKAWLGTLALLLPTVALAGFVSAGNQIARAAADDEKFAAQTLADSNVGEATWPNVERMALAILVTHLGLIVLVLAARGVRRLVQARGMPPLLAHPSGQRLPVLPGASILETLRDHGIPHASVCGGRARCTTCRVRVADGLARLAAPSPVEAQALARIEAPPNVRLACQTRPRSDVTVAPLLPPGADPAAARRPGSPQGRERPVVAMFVDLRESTKLCESRLPYDAVFVMNQFFAEMHDALRETSGYYAQFRGDGLLALYGLESELPQACRDALRGAASMQSRIERLSASLADELAEPMRIGIGMHAGLAIVGTMGPPAAPIHSAIGDNINIAARFEGMTKIYKCVLAVSAETLRHAGVDPKDAPLHQVRVRGRSERVSVYAVADPRSLVGS